MNFLEYQLEAKRTMGGTHDHGDLRLAVFALGVAGEAGEVADLVKKHLGHGKDMFAGNAIVKEIGDVLWYLAAICEETGLSLSDVATANVAKLRARYPDGFSHAAANAKADEAAA